MNNKKMYRRWLVALMIGVALIACTRSPLRKGQSRVLPLSHIADSTWWTDGNTYFSLTWHGDLLAMEGFTLHEGGIEQTLQRVDDTLLIVKDGFAFAEPHCAVRLEQYRLADGEERTLLVAYADKYLTTPVAALQRFDGDEETYEREAYYRMLAGTYVNEQENASWIFMPDGTVRMNDARPQPYTIETSYHMLTDVITLPDSSRVGVSLDENHLYLLAVEWDEVEELWMATDPITGIMTAQQQPDWMGGQLFGGAMHYLALADWLQELAKQGHASSDAFTRLNASLMDRYLEKIELFY